MTWEVPYIDLGAQYRDQKSEIDAAVQSVLHSGRYINGGETEKFERSMAEYLGVSHVIGGGNGYDALFLSLKALGIGKKDWVLTDKYTHVSTHAAILNCGAGIVYEETPDTTLWLPVHMNGRVQDLSGSPFPIVEDACQALGASLNGEKAGTFGLMGCFSLHPMKVLGCAGDGGFIATDDRTLNDRLRALRNHGEGGYGFNSRLDNLQAAILNVKLKSLDWYIQRRREIASVYESELPSWVQKPPSPNEDEYFDTYSSYVIGGSPKLLAHLRFKGIECFSHVRTDVVSLPIYPEMTDEQVRKVVRAVSSYG